LGYSTCYGVSSCVNPRSLEKNAFVYLDSRFRLISKPGREEIAWDYIEIPNTQEGSVNSIRVVRDIIELEIFEFDIPFVPEAITSDRRISLFISEFSPQSFIAHEDRKFHFVFKTTVIGNRIELEPIINKHRFEKTFTKIDSLIISFGAPLSPIVFDPDRLNTFV